MQVPQNNLEQKPSEKENKNHRMKGAFLAFLPSILFLIGFSFSPIRNAFGFKLVIVYFILNGVFSFVGSRNIFPSDEVLTIFFMIVFFGLNIAIPIYIGCVQGTARIS